MSERKTGVNDRTDLPLALVVGVGGMGMAAARRLGERNRLILTDKDPGRLAQCVTTLATEGHDVIAHACDITEHNAVCELVEKIRATGRLRALGHVAGLSPSMGSWDAIMRVNLVGAALMEQAALSVAEQGTTAVFISSLAAHGAPPAEDIQRILDDPLAEDFLAAVDTAMGGNVTTQQAYQLSKFGMNRMVERRAGAWGKRGARIVSLSPGLIATPMGALEFKNVPIKYELLEKTPVQREGTMLEIADAIEFLTSDKASFISGTDLLVDGGIAAVLKHGG